MNARMVISRSRCSSMSRLTKVVRPVSVGATAARWYRIRSRSLTRSRVWSNAHMLSWLAMADTFTET